MIDQESHQAEDIEDQLNINDQASPDDNTVHSNALAIVFYIIKVPLSYNMILCAV